MQTMPAFLGNEGGVFIGHWISLNREQEMSILGNRTSTVVIPSRADGQGSHNGAFDHASTLCAATSYVRSFALLRMTLQLSSSDFPPLADARCNILRRRARRGNRDSDRSTP